MSSGSPSTSDLPPVKTPKDARPGKFSKLSVSARQRFRGIFGRSEKSQSDILHLQPNTSRTTVLDDPEPSLNRDADARIASTVSLPDSRAHKGLTPFEDSKRSRNRSQNSVLRSDVDVPQPHGQNAPSTFHSAHDFNIGANAHFLNVGSMVNQYSGTYGLEILKEFVSFNALYDSSVQDPQRKCHPGTRESILKQMHHWIDNPNPSQPILWLHGPAGVGKSAIAQTIAHSYSDSKVIAATFFFFRLDPSRSNGDRLFPTIAWQLAKFIPGARSCISDALNDDSDIPRKIVEVQFKRLISQPLQSIAQGTYQAQELMPVVIIDGVDECSDEKLQERLINILGEATADGRIPLRFLISSRPEALIKEAFEQFRDATLHIDLAAADEAHRDVEKYFKTEFARIASKQGIDSDTWPGGNVIQDLTSRSSGQFVYASTVIKFVGYEYDSAPSQLDIILGLEPSDGKAPFAELDTLYLEILRRQPEQRFLKDFLALLLAKCDYEDYGLLLKISSKAVFRKLRGMHSVLKTEPKFDVHHRSFLDFLQDASRSRQHHLTTQISTRRYLDLIVDVLVRYTTKVLKQPDYHGDEHFAPKFGDAARKYPRWIDLPPKDWDESLRPLCALKDELLKSSKLCSSWKRGLCDECSALYIVDDLLLHSTFYSGISCATSVQSFQEEREFPDVFPDTLVEDTQNIPETYLTSLLLILRNGQASKNKMTINNLCTLLRFDPAVTASNIVSVLDAQNLIDYLHYMLMNKKFPSQNGNDIARQATLLAVEIYARITLLPHVFLDKAAISIEDEIVRYRRYKGKCQGKPVVVRQSRYHGSYYGTSMFQTALIYGIVSHKNIPELLGISEEMPGPHFSLVLSYSTNHSLRLWRKELNPSVVEIQKHLCDVARALQYMHSAGFVLDEELSGESIDLDSNFQVQLPLRWLSFWYCHRIPPRYKISNAPADAVGFHTYERGVFMYGCLFYEILFDVGIPYKAYFGSESTLVKTCPDGAEIDDKTWRLIQHCCADDPKGRPTMAQVVEEMESWESA